ncbi:MAG: PEGA domain-containing protein [Dehalococcoidales bacterium]|nr:PEGA domain-containing protein [Dehalococcoidales bacterium]
MNLSKNRTLFTISIALILLLIATAAIFWARGFKPDFRKGTISRTGLIVASSVPTGAQVYLNDRLTSATDTNIAYLDPGGYKVKIAKDGYTTWEKQIEIKADLATEIKVLLFPTAPQITPLTTTGAASPTLSPDSSKLVYGVAGARGGAYLLPMGLGIFPFRQDARLLSKNTAALDFSTAKFTWDPDSKQIIATFIDQNGQAIANLTLDSDKTDQTATDVTASLNSLISSWQDQLMTRAQTQAVPFPQSVKDATAAAAQPSPSPQPNLSLTTDHSPLNYYPTGLILSPDEEKVLYKDKAGKYRVYDLKNKKEYTLPDFADLANISWFPDSAHLVVAQNPPTGGLISIIETDGTNKMGIYSGKFENACPPSAPAHSYAVAGGCGRGFVFAHPSANKIIILTTLTQQEGTPPNLYGINLK